MAKRHKVGLPIRRLRHIFCKACKEDVSVPHACPSSGAAAEIPIEVTKPKKDLSKDRLGV